jgi:Fe-S-cluster-containing dehydrogenase component
MKAFAIDISICNGCYNCQIACKDEHVGNDWTPIAKPQPDTGQFWLKLHEFIRGTVPKVKMHYLPILCMHCDKAPCIKACPIKGALYKRDDGLVIIDAEKCTGCRNCVDACPYKVIYFNEDLNLAQKCTGCAHLLDRGWKEPRCVDACPTQALMFGEESELKERISKSEVLKGDLETKPRVYYKDIPGKFVAGTVYDPVKKEVIIGATCTLSGAMLNEKAFIVSKCLLADMLTCITQPVGEKHLIKKTDGFGDFWFEGLEVGIYTLKIEAKGFPTKTISGINTEKDVNLGDIPIS